MNKKKISPLIAIILAAVIFSAGLGLAAWYWTSQTLTYTLTVDGQISATTNFNGDTLIGVTTYAALETACVDEILPNGGNYIIRIAAQGGNPTDVYAKLEITLPGTSTCTAVLKIATYTNGVIGTGTIIGPISTDGSQSVQIIKNANPTWFLESDYASGIVNVAYITITIDWDLSLPIGEHVVSATISLGDSL